MKKIIGIKLWLLLPSLLWAQGGLVNSGATIHIASDVVLSVPNGHISTKKQGVIANQGTIEVGKNWEQLGAATRYKGNGILWFIGKEEQALKASSKIEMTNLGINSTANVRLENDLNVTRNLYLKKGNISLGANNLVLQSNAKIKNYNAASYIKTNGKGELVQTVGTSECVFPIGNTHYTPTMLSNRGTEDAFGLRVTNDAVFSNAIAQSWLITEAVLGDSDIQLTLQWRESDEPIDFNRNTANIIGENLEDYTLNTDNSIEPNQRKLTRSNIKKMGWFSILSKASTESDLPINLHQVTLLPNPVNNKAWLKMNNVNAEQGIVRIYGMNGKLLSEENFVSDHLVPLKGIRVLDSGAYWVQILWDNGTSKSLPFIKQ